MESSTITAPPPTTPDSAASTGSVAYRLRWVVLAVVLGANIMDLLDSTIVNVAGPSIHADLGGSASTLQWLSAGYTLTFAVFLIAGARLGDILGRRRLLLIGQAGFTIFSAASAAAPTMTILIACRALQGAFGALMIPQGLGLIKEAFPPDEMGKAMGLFGPAMGLPMLAAPVLAGALVDANLWGTGWRLVFLINVPIGIVSFILGVRTLPRGASHAGAKLDWGGVGIIGLALVAIIYPLIQGRTEGWPLWIFAMLAAGAALVVVFVIYESRRTHDPLIEPTLLKNRAYLSGLGVLVSFFGAFGGLLLTVSLYGQLGEHWSPIHAGLTLTPMVVGMILGMVGGFALLPKLGRRLLQVGILLVMGRRGRAGADHHRRRHRLDLGPGAQPVLHRHGRRDVARKPVPVHPGRRQHERRRLRLGCARGQSAARHRARRRRAGDDLLLGLRSPPAAARALGHRLGVPGATDGRVRVRVPAADAAAARGRGGLSRPGARVGQAPGSAGRPPVSDQPAAVPSGSRSASVASARSVDTLSARRCSSEASRARPAAVP